MKNNDFKPQANEICTNLFYSQVFFLIYLIHDWFSKLIKFLSVPCIFLFYFLYFLFFYFLPPLSYLPRGRILTPFLSTPQPKKFIQLYLVNILVILFLPIIEMKSGMADHIYREKTGSLVKKKKNIGK